MHIDGYIKLISDFLEKKIEVSEFQRIYIKVYLKDESEIDDTQFNILEKFFTEVEGYSGGNTEDDFEYFEYTEATLRDCAEEALENLKLYQAGKKTRDLVFRTKEKPRKPW